MNRRVAVRGLFIRENKLLCVWHKEYKNQPVDYWCLVGGGVDPGEDLTKALKREILEETGIEAKVRNLYAIQQFMHNGQKQMELFYNITNVDDFLNVDLSATTHGKLEIEKIDYIDVKDHKVLPTFLQDEDFSNYNCDQACKYFSYL